MANTLIIGYGNPDRQDDGVAWHIMRAIATLRGLTPSPQPEEAFSNDAEVDFLFNLQLVPEFGEKIAAYKRVCFIDAHTGAIPEEIHSIQIDAAYQHTPFTHHMTPQTCLEIAKTIYDASPESVLVSVRGYEFGFSNDLSEMTSKLVQPAARRILDWLNTGKL